MPSLRLTTASLAHPPRRLVQGWLSGVPFAIAGIAPGFLFGWRACFAALLLAGVASFLVYIPMTVLVLNGGVPLPEDAPAPGLTVRSYCVLLLLWMTTVWITLSLLRI
jgi:hypothetical protein